MGVAMELACSRSSVMCSSSSTWRQLTSSFPTCTSGPQSVTFFRRRRRRTGGVRAAAGEDVGTEDKTVAATDNKSQTPPIQQKKWTGYVEKDTAAQSNIYAVEPTVYVADSVFSSGEAGKSTAGSSNSAAVAAGFALITIAGAATILLQNRSPATSTTPVEEVVGYNGPPLSFYIAKFSSKGDEASALAAPSLVSAPAPEAKATATATESNPVVKEAVESIEEATLER